MSRYFIRVLIITLLLLSHKSFSQVTVYSSDTLSCTVLCTTLNAVVVGDTPIDAGVTSDDIYSGLHSIGFPFNFYGVNYTQVVLGANGTLDFNVGDAGAGDPWPITAPLLGNPSKLNNICGPWCDIDIFFTGIPVGSEKYSTDGAAPFRKFVVSWCGCSMFSCGTQITTTQIILYETTNIIEVHIAQKPVCSTWNGGYAIVGVQNAAGTDAVTAPGRDFPSVWTIPPTEAWRFTPIPIVGGGVTYTVASIPYAPIPYQSSAVYWYNASTGAYLGTGTSIVVCPTTRTTYKAGALGCADTSFGYYTVNPTGSIVITTSSTNPTICGACDGTITINGLTPGRIDTINYDYGGIPQPQLIRTVSGGGTITITGLCAGSYTNITARQGGCLSLPHAVTLTDPPISIASVTTANPTKCGLCDGILVIHGLYPSHAFTINYYYNGTPQPPISTSTSPSGTITLTGLCAGIYDNIVASYGSCITPPVGPYTLLDPPISISSVTPTNPTACGVCDGILVLHGLYSSHAFTINYNFNGVAQAPVSTISSGTGTVTLTGLCEGVYDNIVASFGSCVTPPVGPYTLIAPAPPTFFITSFTNPTQCGYCDGSIIIHGVPPGSIDSIFYTRNGVVQPPMILVGYPDSTLHMDGLCSGNYTSFTNKIGPCLSPVVGGAVLVDPPLTAGFSDAVHYGCKGDTVFYFNSSMSTGPLYYVWHFGDGYTDTATNPSHIFAQGVYTVTLIATNLYCLDSFKLKDSLLHPLSAQFTDTPSIVCQNDPVSFSNYSFGTGTSYAWSFGNGATSNLLNPTYTYNNSGVYKVQLIATDFVPCYDTATALVQVDSLSPVSIQVSDSVLCRSTSVTFKGVYTGIGNTGVSWFFGDGDSIVNINPVIHSYDAAGQFTVSVIAHYRVCKDVGTSRVINLFASPNVYLGGDTSICPGSTALKIGDNINAGNSAARWKWTTGQTTPFISVVAPGRYGLKVIVDGCESSDSIWVINDCYMNIPNVFTPNGDGSNDYFFPRQYLTKGLTSFKMEIYNRWGQLVFETTTLNGAGWDGKFNDKDQPVGVYVYKMDATFKDGQKETHQGNVTLLR